MDIGFVSVSLIFQVCQRALHVIDIFQFSNGDWWIVSLKRVSMPLIAFCMSLPVQPIENQVGRQSVIMNTTLQKSRHQNESQNSEFHLISFNKTIAKNVTRMNIGFVI